MPYPRRARCRSSGWRGCSACPSDRAARCTSSSSAPASTAVGLAVDRIVGQREIVVRAHRRPLVRVDGDLRRDRPRRRPRRADPRSAGAGAAARARPRRRRGASRGVTAATLDTTSCSPSPARPTRCRSRDVAHIEMVEQITRVPNAPPFVDGVVFSRGQVVPAVNLRARFGFERAPLRPAHPAARRADGRPQRRPAGRRARASSWRIPPDVDPAARARRCRAERPLRRRASPTIGDRLILVLNLDAVAELRRSRVLAALSHEEEHDMANARTSATARTARRRRASTPRLVLAQRRAGRPHRRARIARIADEVVGRRRDADPRARSTRVERASTRWPRR